MVYVRKLRWDAWNVAHIARHSVTPEEVEEVCQGAVMIGPSGVGRMLTVILAPEGEDIFYVITARPASRRERRRYLQEMGD